VAINSRKVNYILDADVENFFGAVDQTWMVRFLERQCHGNRQHCPLVCYDPRP